MGRFKSAEARLSLATTGPYGVFSFVIGIWAAEEPLSKALEIQAFIYFLCDVSFMLTLTFSMRV